MNFIEEAAALQDTLLKYRRYFHQYPEVSRQEFNTAGKIVEILSGLGLEVQSQVAHPLPGVVALLRGGHPGPTVALRADMDALSQTEARDCPYRSRNPGAQHGCGHDAEMASLLGAAAVLSKYSDELKQRVVFLFQPAGEGRSGAKTLTENNIIDKFNIGRSVAVNWSSELPYGELFTRRGVMTALSDRIHIDIRGTAAITFYRT